MFRLLSSLRFLLTLLAIGVASCFCGCSEPTLAPGSVVVGVNEPNNIEVQFILVSFDKARLAEKLGVTRNRQEALERIAEIEQLIKDNVDFMSLVQKYSDDPIEENMKLANHGAPTSLTQERDTLINQIKQRRFVAKSFGDTAFSLEPNEVRLAEYHPEHCDVGWYFIKRIW